MTTLLLGILVGIVMTLLIQLYAEEREKQTYRKKPVIWLDRKPNHYFADIESKCNYYYLLDNYKDVALEQIEMSMADDKNAYVFTYKNHEARYIERRRNWDKEYYMERYREEFRDSLVEKGVINKDELAEQLARANNVVELYGEKYKTKVKIIDNRTIVRITGSNR
jgi:hypothetical protein